MDDNLPRRQFEEAVGRIVTRIAAGSPRVTEVVEEAKLQILPNLPTVTVLALIKDISHDEAEALCATSP